MAALRPFFFEAPTETVGRRPCSHGGGPLRELDGQCPPSPIAGSPVPCSALAGAAPEHQRYARTHRPPAQRLSPVGPASLLARPSQRTAAAPGLRPAAKAAPLHRDPPAPGSVGLGLSPPVLARRSAAVSAPPLASLRPSGGSDGSGTRSSGSPLGCFGWACGPPYAPLRVRLRPFCAAASAGPPKTAPSASCPPSSLGRLAAWAGCGLRSSRPGPGAALAVRFLRPPAPGALGRRQMQQRDSGVIQGGFRLIERSLGGGEPPQRLPCITLNLICC